MSIKKNRFSFHSDQERLQFLQSIIGFFQDHRGEEIGIIAAEDLLEFFQEKLGPEIYKRAVHDCQEIIRQKNDDLAIEIDSLTFS